jgi:NTP pyrophosphatase (non-canonical NTP hydrolase)
MEVTQYQDLVRRTAIFPQDHGLVYATIGLTGEAGEVADKVKKMVRRYKDTDTLILLSNMTNEDRRALAHEIGDVLWYATALAKELGFNLSEIMQMNSDKLVVRLRANTLDRMGD